MKVNKKILVPVLSTVMGLSLIGGVSGAVAWYQFNSRVTTSFIGTSVADSGILQIGQMGTSGIEWGRDVTETGSTNDNKLLPVTFGVLDSTTNALPDEAYGYPEAGKPLYSQWTQATKGKEYVQYDVYLRAQQADGSDDSGYSLVAKDVYLSDITMDVVETAKASIGEALRIHIAVDGGKNFLIAQNTVTQLPLSGKMDLDGDGELDKVGGYAWETGRTNDVIYGTQGTFQDAAGISEMECPRDANGDLTNTSADNKILTTKTTGETKVTITVWLEGWEKMGTAETAVWDAFKTAGASVHVGLTFDVGKNAFRS